MRREAVGEGVREIPGPMELYHIMIIIESKIKKYIYKEIYGY